MPGLRAREGGSSWNNNSKERGSVVGVRHMHGSALERLYANEAGECGERSSFCKACLTAADAQNRLVAVRNQQ